MLIVDLIQNFALLITLCFLFDILVHKQRRYHLFYSLLTGLLFGLVTVIGMLTPMRFSEGIFFDGRSVVLSIGAFFGGPPVALVSTLIALCCRTLLGGAGVFVGNLVVLESSLIGLFFYRLRRRGKRTDTLPALILQGGLVHAGMLLLQLLNPGDVGLRIVRDLGPIILPLYSIAFVITALLFIGQEKRRRMEKELTVTKYAFEHANLEIYCIRERDGRIFNPNIYCCEALGYSREELESMSIREIDPNYCWEYWEKRKELLHEGSGMSFETFHRRKDGSFYPVEISVSYKEIEGEVFCFSFCGNISRRLETSQRMEEAIHEKEILLREIHHRVRNSFSIIVSLMSLQEASVHSPGGAVDAMHRIRERISAMSEVYNLLYTPSRIGNIDMGEYLQDLINKLVQSYRTSPLTMLDLKLESCRVDIDRAVLIGLILDELLSNVFQHAFRPDEEGTISCSLSLRRDGKALLCLKDNGRGFDLVSLSREQESLGFRLIQELAAQADVQMSFSSKSGGGTEVLMYFLVESLS